MHHNKLLKLPREKLGNNLALKLASSLGSSPGTNLSLNLLLFLDLNLDLNLLGTLPGGQSLVRTLYGKIVVPAVPDHYI